MGDVTRKNAKIGSTMLGREDHGIMTFMLQLDFSGSGQGCGGYSFSNHEKKGDCSFAIDLISKILDVVGVMTWEELVGTPCCAIYIDCSYDIKGIGHYLDEDNFVIFKDFAKEYHPQDTP